MQKIFDLLNPLTLWHTSAKFRFLLIGAWNTLVGYAVFAGLYLLVGHWIGYLATAVGAHLLAVTQSFVAQRRLVFRSQGVWWKEYCRFHIAHLGSLLVGLALLSLLVELLHLQPLLAQALVTVLSVVLSYFLHQHFTFRKPVDEN